MIQRSKALWRATLSDRLLRSCAWILFAVVTGGVANYGLQVVLGRFLSTTEYGFFNALLGVFVVLGVPVATLLMLVSRKTAQFRASFPLSTVAHLFQTVSKRVFIASVIGLVVFVCFSAPLAHFLRSDSLVPIVLLGLCVAASVSQPVPLAVLQGMQLNSWFAFFQGFNGPARFLFCAVAAVAGFGVNGVLFGLFLSLVCAWAFSFLVVKKQVGAPDHSHRKESLAWGEAWPVLIANLAFALITQADMVLVNRYFQPADSSVYASAAVLGRSVIYVPGALVLAMFPMVSESKAKNISTRPLLFKSLGLTVLLSGVGALLFFFWPNEILNLLFGDRYAASAPILKYYGLTMLPLAMLMVLMNYFIARGDSAFGFVMLVGAIVEIALIAFFHSSLLSVVLIFGCVGVCLLLFGVLMSFVRRFSTDARSSHVVTPVGA